MGGGGWVIGVIWVRVVVGVDRVGLRGWDLRVGLVWLLRILLVVGVVVVVVVVVGGF